MSHDNFPSRCSAADFPTCAENVAWNSGYGLAKGNKETMNGWIKSHGHYVNLVGPKYNLVGYGYHECDDGKIYWTGLYGKRA
jgi:uncharacterized protein YkwD